MSGVIFDPRFRVASANPTLPKIVDGHLSPELHHHPGHDPLHRCLQRHGVSCLPEVDGDKPAKKNSSRIRSAIFTSTSPLDEAQDTKVQTAQSKLYLYVAIDRTSKLAFVDLHEKATTRISGDFVAPPHRRRAL